MSHCRKNIFAPEAIPHVRSFVLSRVTVGDGLRAALRSFWSRRLIFCRRAFEYSPFCSPKFPSSLICTRSSKSEPVNSPSLWQRERKWRKRTVCSMGSGILKKTSDSEIGSSRSALPGVRVWRSAHSKRLRFAMREMAKARWDFLASNSGESSAWRREATRCCAVSSPERRG